MISRSTTVGLFTAVVLAAVAVWFVHQNVDPDGAAPRERLLLLSDVAKFDYLEIETGGVVLVCQLKQGTWWIVRPVAARADDERIHRLLDTLAVASVQDVITLDEQRFQDASQRDYGLVDSCNRIFLRGPGVPALELRLGAVAPHGQSLYVGITGSPKIWVTEPELLNVLPAGMGDIRDRALLPHPASRLRRFELRSPGSVLIAAECDTEGVWWLRQPEARLADQGAVAALLGYVEDARILSFVHTVDHEMATGATVSDLGITYGCTSEDASLIARFWFAGTRTALEYHELLVGKPVIDGSDQVYLLSTEESLVVTVPSTFPHMLRVEPDVLRDRRVWPFDAHSVQRIGIQGEAGSVVVDRSPAGVWMLTEPIQAAGRPETCSNLFARVMSLRDHGIADTNAPPRYDFLVELVQDAPAPSHTALVSRVGSTQGLGSEFDWFIPASGTRQRVDSEALPENFGMPSFFASLRDNVLLRVEHSTLSGVTVQEGSNVVFQAFPGTDAVWTSPGGGDSENGQPVDLGKLFARVRQFEALRVEALAPASLDDYGLREPVLSLTLRFRDPEQPARILALGALAPEGGRYAMLKGQDSVFVLSREDSELLTSLRAVDDGKPR